MTHIAQIIAQEIYQQLQQTLQQTGLTYTETTNTITYKDKIQQNTQITLNDLSGRKTTYSHIQIQKHPAYWELPIKTTDIIIDEQNIYIRAYNQTEGKLTYELTDPHAIQNTIKTITKCL